MVKTKKDWCDEIFHGLDEFGFTIGSKESKEMKKKSKKKDFWANKPFDIGV